jgi:hypothetical protein
MSLFCKIEDNNGVMTLLQGPVTLPNCEANVSNFNAISDLTVLKSYGWVPYEKITEDKEIFVSSEIEVLEDKVVETIITRDKTNKEKSDEQWQLVREKRDELLRSSDIDVLADKWENLTIEQRNALSKYRQSLRDLPQDSKSPFKINWPVKP